MKGVILLIAALSASVVGCTTLSTDDAPPYDPSVSDSTARREPDCSVPTFDDFDPTALIAEMTLRERIAQRFIVFVPRSLSLDDRATVDEFTTLLSEERPGGVILYPWNYETSEDVRRLTSEFQSVAARDLDGRMFLICADQEGGRVAGFRFPDIVRLPSAYRVALHDDLRFVEAAAYVNAVEMRDMGVNMNLAPVLDVTDAPDSGIIGDRSFGSNTPRVAAMGEIYIRAFRDADVIATAKHFPGHGVTEIDSHGRLPVVDMTRDALHYADMLPFAAAIDAGVPVIMTAHILFPEIDPVYPVTISQVFLQQILRDELGFSGVVMSDGLEMGALADNFDLETTLERAIRYGVDIILLYASYDLREMVDTVERLVSEGRLGIDEIDRGVARILILKHRYGLLEERS